MRIIIICNNVEGNFDGIGKHAHIVGEDLQRRGHDVETISGMTYEKGRFGKILSLEMSKAFIRAGKTVRHKKVDNVIIEYPFMEYNPLIVLFHIWLYFICHKYGTKLAFSMHEYDRVHPLRQRIIDVFLKYCDVLFVSEKKYFESLGLYRDRMFIRSIPNNILPKTNKKIFDNKKYCYIGLVNPSKAFKEMLEAWKIFNEKGNYTLTIISATLLDENMFEGIKGIIYMYDLPNEETANIILSSSYSIVPVIPEIGLNNSSLITSTQCGCVAIGKFNEDLRAENFILHTDGYDIKSFVSVLNRSQEIDSATFAEMSRNSFTFGSQFSVAHTVDQMLIGLNREKSQS